jgi:hypothetical protein
MDGLVSDGLQRRIDAAKDKVKMKNDESLSY